MVSHRIEIDSVSEHVDLPHMIEEACRALGLRATLLGTLKSYPGSIHWHIKKGQERGTLELTYWPKAARLWLSVRRGRDAEWVLPAMKQIKGSIEQDIG